MVAKPLCPLYKYIIKPLDRAYYPELRYIQTFFDDSEWIMIDRQKTGVRSTIKLLDYPKSIMEKYRGLCADGRIFLVPCYSDCRGILLRVAKRCGITKHLTWP